MCTVQVLALAEYNANRVVQISPFKPSLFQLNAPGCPVPCRVLLHGTGKLGQIRVVPRAVIRQIPAIYGNWNDLTLGTVKSART